MFNARKKSKSFTLVEILTVVFLGTIIILAAYSVYAASYGSYKRNSASSELTQNARIALELLSHSPGLNIATQTGTQILANDLDRFEIGQGDDWSFTPVFWVDNSAAPGTYSAQLRLVDESGAYLPSGSFNLDFAVVPEPTSLALAGAGLAAIAVGRRRGS